MKTNWDYTDLADAYLKRPDYAPQAIDKMVALANCNNGDLVCDIGAGTGHLTKLLLDRNLKVRAIEPNDAMRANGIKVTAGRNAEWLEGTGEDSRQPDQQFKLVTFGSSFNTTDRPKALAESHRILAQDGWFACMWNHRDLEEKTQKQVEDLIKKMVPEYAYGTRREDQTEVINSCGLFKKAQFLEGTHVVDVKKADYIEAWRSHATLQRQAGSQFSSVIEAIEQLLKKSDSLNVPYTTRIWMAQKA
jgi:ubiquinone/menaquinone biosynthesis C-methylase UbiE